MGLRVRVQTSVNTYLLFELMRDTGTPSKVGSELISYGIVLNDRKKILLSTNYFNFSLLLTMGTFFFNEIPTDLSQIYRGIVRSAMCQKCFHSFTRYLLRYINE